MPAVMLPACAVSAVVGIFEQDAQVFERDDLDALPADRASDRTLAALARSIVEQVKTTGAVDLASQYARTYFFDALQHGASRALDAGRWADVRAFAITAGLVEAKG